MAKKNTTAIFLDQEFNEIRIIYPEIKDGGVSLRLWNKDKEITSRSIIIPSLDDEGEPNGPPIQIENIRFHHHPHMENVILEIKGSSHLAFLRVAKRDLAVTPQQPLFCPHTTIKVARVSDSFCSVQAVTGTYQRYALIIFDFERNIKIRPSISVDHKASQIALFGSRDENLIFFLENYNGKYHLNWVDPVHDWKLKTKKKDLEDIAPKEDAIIHMECFGNNLVILTQDRKGRYGVANYYVIIYEINKGNITKKRVIRKDFGCPISWDIHDEGVLALCHYEEYAWIDLLLETTSDNFDGFAHMEGKPDITFARLQEDGSPYMIAWKYDSFPEANMFVSPNDNDRPSTASIRWNNLCHQTSPSKFEVLGTHLFLIHRDAEKSHVSHGQL